MSTFVTNHLIAIVALLGLFAFLAMVYRLVREIIPTLRQTRRTIKELELTIRNSQEIIYNLKSITRNMDEQVQELHTVVEDARGIVHQVEMVTSTVTKPIITIRSLLSGVGQGMKYLVKRTSSEEEPYPETESPKT
jgi:uncharacterized protein YoxC